MTTIGKMTLLEMTQAILEKMESDEVSSITDTVESLSVAGEIRDTFRTMFSNSEDYQKTGYRRLEGLADSKRFNQLKIPEDVNVILELWLQDPCDPCKRITPCYMEPDAFVDRLFKRAGENTVGVPPYDQDGPCFPVGCDEDPKYYTTFDGVTVFFDSVDTSVYQTLFAEQTAIRATIAPEFRMEDGFIPDIKVTDFPYLLNDAIDACFINFKGVSNSKAQKRVRDQKVMRQNNRDKVGNHTNPPRLPPYGRYSRGGALQNLQGGGNQNS